MDEKPADPTRCLNATINIAAALATLLHLAIPTLAIDAITLAFPLLRCSLGLQR